jgi:plasmid stabilization system protein ParE
MEKNRKLIWDQQALSRLEKSLEWISETSIQQAEKVEQAILEQIEIVRLHPERHPPDKYKQNNSGDYRAFETHSYRIT